jgi:hypothetical protein
MVRKNRKTFRTSRKIDAASRGAAVTSWERRRGWKFHFQDFGSC